LTQSSKKQSQAKPSKDGLGLKKKLKRSWKRLAWLQNHVQNPSLSQARKKRLGHALRMQETAVKMRELALQQK
jgi:hypothetical protein